MRCYKARSFFSPYIDGVLTKWETEQLETHLKNCQKCRIHFEEILAIHNQFINMERFSAPLGLTTRIIGKIETENKERFPLFNVLIRSIEIAIVIFTIIMGTRLGQVLGTMVGNQESSVSAPLFLDTFKAVQPSSIGAAYLAMVADEDEK